MPVLFDRAMTNGAEHNQTVEEVFRIFGSWAGIHDFQFGDLFSMDSIDIPASSESWQGRVFYSTVTPYEFELQYTTTSLGHGAIVRKKADGTYLLVGIDTNGDGIVKYWNGSSYTNKMIAPLSNTPTQGDVRLAFRQMRFSDQKSDVWNVVSIWINESLMFTYHEFVGETFTENITFGFATQGSALTITDVRIPLLSEFSEWSSLDIGEFPQGGLQRAIEGRYTKHFIRFDESMKVWRPVTTSSEKTFYDADIYKRSVMFDRRQVATHVRVLGAYVQAKFIDYTLLSQHGDRFVEINNPFLMSEAECYRQARFEVLRRLEQATIGEFSHPLYPVLEPEDHISIDGDEHEWIISGVSYEIRPNTIIQTFKLRKYTIYGS